MASANESTATPTTGADTEATGCCGGPAPAGATACCARDADVKAAGGDGCGCGAPARTAPKAPAAGCCTG